MSCVFLSSQCEVAVVLVGPIGLVGWVKAGIGSTGMDLTCIYLGPALWMNQPPYLEGVPIPAVLLQALAGQRGMFCTCVWSRVQDLNTFLGEKSL